MNLNLTGRQFEITPSIREYVTARVAAVTEDKSLNITSINVVMELEKNRFKTNVVLNCKYHVFEATVEDFDLYKSFDAAAEKIDAQLTKLKEKIRNNRQADPMRVAEAKSTPPEAEEVEEAEETAEAAAE